MVVGGLKEVAAVAQRQEEEETLVVIVGKTPRAVLVMSGTREVMVNTVCLTLAALCWRPPPTSLRIWYRAAWQAASLLFFVLVRANFAE